MFTRTFTFTLIFFACMLAIYVQAATEESSEAVPSSPKQSPPSPKQLPSSPKQSPASPERVLSTKETPLSRAIQRIPKHIDDQPISLRHKIMKSQYDTNVKDRQSIEGKKEKARRRFNGYTGYTDKGMAKASKKKMNRQANKEKAAPY